jgi:hypothetical protein
MTNPKYDNNRPRIPADVRRSVEVESGHCCGIKGCVEHTYLEIHHIDENRENNEISNLVLLCDKHHKMAHAKVIDRKALKEYKNLLQESHDRSIHDRVEKLERMLEQSENLIEGNLKSSNKSATENNETLRKESSDRSDIMTFVLKHVAIRHFEKEVKVPFEHQVTFSKGGATLALDALRQDDRMEEDFIIEVQYLRKSYTDAPVYGKWLENKVELYELLTGRKAKGILMIVVGRDRMKDEGGLPLTRQGLSECSRKIELEVYSCSDIGFHPGPISLALSQSYLAEETDIQTSSTDRVTFGENAVKLALFQRFLEKG